MGIIIAQPLTPCVMVMEGRKLEGNIQTTHLRSKAYFVYQDEEKGGEIRGHG